VSDPTEQRKAIVDGITSMADSMRDGISAVSKGLNGWADVIVNRWGEPEYPDQDDDLPRMAAFRAPRNKITENLAAAELRGWKNAMEAINAYASNKLDRYERLETGEAAAGAYSDISTVANLAHQYPEKAKAEIFAKYSASPVGLADEIERAGGV
jgi:hypothetical protein